ncbi:MAG: S-layer homology domain-containing protein, partial [Clostridia bacterium]|nr:S-layer homology domain-containing protein [Clostridia bacterium]
GLPTFHPTEYATREDIAVALVRMMGFTDSDANDKNYAGRKFYDGSSISPSLMPYVSIACERGLISGYPDGNFGPTQGITRAETVVLLNRATKQAVTNINADLQISANVLYNEDEKTATIAEPEVDANTEIVATQTEHQSYDTLYIAVHVSDIMYSNHDIPDITLSITGKNGSDTLTLTRDNFDSDRRAYSGSCNIGSFSAGDEISIAFSSSSENTYLTLIQGSNPVVVKNDPVTYKIESYTYSDPGDPEPTTATYGGYINSPLSFDLNKEVTPSTITLILKDESGNVLPNVQIKCTTPTNSVIKSYTSDANGAVAVDYSAFGDFIDVISCDKDYEVIGTNSRKMITSPKEGRVYTVALKKAEK